MLRLRSLAVALGLTGSLLVLPAAFTSAPACAATGGGPRAGLVVDTGANTFTYCVSLDASSVSGIHLIELASAQHGLQYTLGFGGMAVCQLQGVGPAGDDCFGDYPYFWGYWHGDGGTGWAWSGSGAGSTTITDGEVDGWSWGTGDSGSSHPPPPPLGFDDICTASSPSPKPSPSRSPSTSPTEGGGGGAPSSPSPSGTTSEPSNRDPQATSPTTTAEGSAGVTELPSTATEGTTLAGERSADTGSSGGIPLGALVAVGIVLLLVVAGVLRMRASRSAGAKPGGPAP